MMFIGVISAFLPNLFFRIALRSVVLEFERTDTPVISPAEIQQRTGQVAAVTSSNAIAAVQEKVAPTPGQRDHYAYPLDDEKRTAGAAGR